MIGKGDIRDCCGCGACKAICPVGAISMRTDAMGFPYPAVDEALCIECGKCVKICDFRRKKEKEDYAGLELPVFAARNRDAEVLARSQSGGVFTALGNLIPEEGGAVYGAVSESGGKVAHRRAVTFGERKAFCGSKYIQSDTGDCFNSVRKDLEDGLEVLFSGTPCQVAALLEYIPEKLKGKLFTVDFICHGMPSPAIWRDYLDYMSRKGEIVSYSYRDKEAGWSSGDESVTFADGHKVFTEIFKVLYYKNIMLRPGCGSCPYQLLHRKADITISDFWGIEELLKDFDSSRGVSMVLCNNDKGREYFQRASRDLYVEQVTVTEAFLRKYNPNLLRPSVLHKDSEAFGKAYSDKGFRFVAHRWGNLGWRYKAWKMKVFFKKIMGIK